MIEFIAGVAAGLFIAYQIGGIARRRAIRAHRRTLANVAERILLEQHLFDLEAAKAAGDDEATAAIRKHLRESHGVEEAG